MKWCVQQGVLVVTGSMSAAYDQEDSNLWGWNLTAAEMDRLAALSAEEHLEAQPHSPGLKTDDAAAHTHTCILYYYIAALANWRYYL